MITVKATREGLVGRTTSSGWKIDTHIPYVALPSVRALHKTIWVMNPLNNKSVYAVVLDVGPWNEHDDAYVFQSSTTTNAFGLVESNVRPLSEVGIALNKVGQLTNKAGIDLGEFVWSVLEMTDNGDVQWEFV